MRVTFKKASRGQAIFETMLVLPLFLTVVVFAVQVTLIARAKSVLNLSAYYAARSYASTQEEYRGYNGGKFYASPLLVQGSTNLQVNFYNPDGSTVTSWVFGNAFRSEVTVDYPLLVPLMVPIFGKAGSKSGTVQLSASCYTFMEGSN